MLKLLLATFAMMGLTFVIGFFVAAVIKLIASAADSLDFYSSHQVELQRLRRLKKVRQNVERLLWHNAIAEQDGSGDKREDYSRGINRDIIRYHGYYHGVSPGESDNNLLEYYYPEDTHIVYLEKREEMLQQHKDNSKKSSTNTK